MRKTLLLFRGASLLLMLLLAMQFAIAQTATIKGNVKDANGNPLSGASVTAEGQKGGTLSDVNGNYILKVQAGSITLVISYVGQTPKFFTLNVVVGETVVQNADLTEVTDLSGVVVLGSRARVARSKLSTPVPVDVIQSRELKQFPQTDLTQALTYTAPSFQSSRQTISDGTDHIDPAGLRGLGPDQTLVLLNGKRRHNTALVNINGTVGRGSVGTDLNAIPIAAIDRIEVLRDGAAAQYGSDAIAGVINIVLKKNYSGLSFSGMAGQNFTNMPYNGGQNIQDGLNGQVDFTWGLTGKKQNQYLVISGQWLKRDATNRSGNDNIPLLYMGNGGAFPGATPTGVTPVDYRRWLIGYDDSIVRSRAYDKHNIVAGNSASENLGFFINAATPIKEKLNLYTTIGVSTREGSASGFSRNPNSMSQQPVKADGQRYYYDGFLPEIHSLINDYSVTAGLQFPIIKWDGDFSYTRGENGFNFYIENTGNASFPPSNDVQTKFDAGELRFAQGTMNLDFTRKFDLQSGKSVNVAFGGEWRKEIYKIGEGEPNSYLNGPNDGGRLATFDPIPPYPGTNQYIPIAPTNATPGAQVFPGFKPTDAIRATREIYAAYGDFEFTLGKLLLDAAVRYENYNESQSNKYDNISGKLSGRYEVNKDLSIRGSISTGFRAPSLHQRYFQNTSTQFVGGLPSQALTANNNNPIVRDPKGFGIDALSPEKSKSATIGVAGRVAKNITFTVDGYFIRIENRIVLSTQFQRTDSLVAIIMNRYGVDPSINALQFWTNAVNTETKGVDLVVTDRFKLGKGNASVSVAANFNHNMVVGPLNTNSVIDSAAYNPGQSDPDKYNPAKDFSNLLFDRQQRSRIEVAQPQTKVNITLAYDLHKIGFSLRTVRFGETQFLNANDPFSHKSNGVYWNDIGFGADQTFSAKWVTDLIITLRPISGLSVSVGANNIFDIYPDRVFIDPRNDAAAVYANPVQSSTSIFKSTGGYSAGRDASNRGRFLFSANQFGFNGRFLFARLAVDMTELKRMGKK